MMGYLQPKLLSLSLHFLERMRCFSDFPRMQQVFHLLPVAWRILQILVCLYCFPI